MLRIHSPKRECREEVYIEFLRVLASFFCMYFFVKDVLNFSEGFVPFSLVSKRSCIFFMISGSVLLGKKESLKDIWIKRVLRIGLIILGISLVILIYRKDFDYYSWFNKILYNKVNSYLAFLYVYALVMVCLPFLRIIAQNISPKAFLCILIIEIGNKIALEVIDVSNLNILFVVMDSILCMYIGYWLENIVDISWNINFVDMFFGFSLVIIMFSYWIAELYLLDILLFICVFLLVKMLFKKYPPSEVTSRIICFLGSLTFGIYLLSGPLQGLSFVVISFWREMSLITCVTIMFIIYGMIIAIFKCIPGLGRIVKWFI